MKAGGVILGNCSGAQHLQTNRSRAPDCCDSFIWIFMITPNNVKGELKVLLLMGWRFSSPLTTVKRQGRWCLIGFRTPRTKVIHSLICSLKLCFYVFFPQNFTTPWLSNNTFILHKAKEDKMNVNVLYFSRWFTMKRKGGKCWLWCSSFHQLFLFHLWFIFACQNNDKLSTCCFFLRANSAVSCVLVLFACLYATFASK